MAKQSTLIITYAITIITIIILSSVNGKRIRESESRIIQVIEKQQIKNDSINQLKAKNYWDGK